MANKDILHSLEQRKASLSKIIHNTEKKLLQAPPGTVEIKKHGNGVQFYHRQNPHEKHGIYIPASDRKRAAALAQKRYLTKVLSAAKEQEKAIGSFLQIYDPDAIEMAFVTEGEVRQTLISPIELPDEELVRQWLAVEYRGLDFSDEARVHYTDRHERVRSKSEVLIANALARANIPYRYEYPLKLGNFVAYPDFTILRLRDRKVIYWEHLGLIDESDYRNRALQKIRSYEEFGIFPGDTLILSMESQNLPLNSVVIQRMIKHYIL